MLAWPLGQEFGGVLARRLLTLAVLSEIWPIHCSCSVRLGEAFGNALLENVNCPRVAVLIFLWHHRVPKKYLEGYRRLPEELRVRKLEGQGHLVGFQNHHFHFRLEGVVGLLVIDRDRKRWVPHEGCGKGRVLRVISVPEQPKCAAKAQAADVDPQKLVERSGAGR